MQYQYHHHYPVQPQPQTYYGAPQHHPHPPYTAHPVLYAYPPVAPQPYYPSVPYQYPSSAPYQYTYHMPVPQPIPQPAPAPPAPPLIQAPRSAPIRMSQPPAARKPAPTPKRGSGRGGKQFVPTRRPAPVPVPRPSPTPAPAPVMIPAPVPKDKPAPPPLPSRPNRNPTFVAPYKSAIINDNWQERLKKLGLPSDTTVKQYFQKTSRICPTAVFDPIWASPHPTYPLYKTPLPSHLHQSRWPVPDVGTGQGLKDGTGEKAFLSAPNIIVGNSVVKFDAEIKAEGYVWEENMFEEEADDEDGEPLPWPPKLKLGRRGRADEPRVLEPNMWSCLSPNTGLVRVKDQQLALADSSADESELPLTPQLTPRAVDYNYHLPIRLRFQSSAGSRKSAKTTKKVPPPLDLSRSKPVVWSQPDVGSRLGVLEEDDREYEAEEEDMSLGETTSESVVSTEEEYDVTPFTRDNSVKSSASSAGDSVEGPRLKKYYMEKYARPQQQSRASYVSILRRGL